MVVKVEDTDLTMWLFIFLMNTNIVKIVHLLQIHTYHEL